MERAQAREKLDIFSPLFVTAIILGLAKDFVSMFFLAVGVPVIGMVIGTYVLALAGFTDLFLAFAVLPKLKHFVPKLILILGFLPLPIVGFTPAALILAIVAQNRLVELAITQAAIQAVAVATGGAGEALEGVAAAGEVAEGAEVVEGGVTAVRGVEKAAEAGGRLKKLGKAAEKGLRAHEERLKRELGEEEEEENGPSAEEIYGIKEPTEVTEELFEPQYNVEQAESPEESELEAQQKFEAKKQREAEERRAREYGGEAVPMPIPRPQANVGAKSDVELEQAA